MRIAMMGTRGVPASYSGFETFVEELGARLAARGHEVTVYCRSHHIQLRDPVYRGMRLVRLPTIRNKYLDTIAHTTLSCLHGLTRRYDVVLMCIVGNSPLSLVPRLVGQRVVLNVDGLDWQRQKWGALATRYLQFSERLATLLPTVTVTDSRVVHRYYRERFGARTACISYGSEVPIESATEVLTRFGLEPRRYLLFVGRLVPENCAHHLVEAFEGLADTRGFKLAIVGDAPYAQEYIRSLQSTRHPDVVFTGYLFGEGYWQLGSHAYAFVETSEVGGTHPALVEAMAFGNCVVVNDTPANLETIGEAGLSYRGQEGAEALRPVLEHLLAAPEMVAAYRQRAAERAKRVYSWDRVTDQYEQLFQELCAGQAVTALA